VTLGLRIGARSDVGLVREGNEDSLYAGHQLLVVADGVGGAVAGEVASSETIRALEPLDNDAALDDPLAALRQAVHSANDRLRRRVEAEPSLTGMGTTLTAMLWVRDRLSLAQVGDSRAYQLRDKSLEQITRDQTFVQMLVDEGRITADQAATHPQRSVILSALDGRDDVEPELSTRDVQAGDRFLLCSDGLSDYVPRDLIEEGLTETDPQAASERLVDLALQAGGADNISCIVIDVVPEDPRDNRLPIVAGAVATQQDQQSDQDTAVLSVGGTTTEQSTQPADRATETGTADSSRTTSHRAGHRSIGRRLAAVAVVVVVLIAAGIVATIVYVHRQWYVAASRATSTGRTVTIYHGVQGSVLGISMSSVQTTTDIPVTSLPQNDAENLSDGLHAGSRSSAESLVAGLRSDSCAQARSQQQARIDAFRRAHPKATAPALKPVAWCPTG
jgi:protein phosphatase